MSGGTSSSNASRSNPASAGACPAVENATVTPPRLIVPPRYAVAFAGSSTALTNTPRASAASRTARLTSGVAAAVTNHAPSRSDAWNSPVIAVTRDRSIAPLISGAITVTSAPAASSAGIFDAATWPPPTTTTRR